MSETIHIQKPRKFARPALAHPAALRPADWGTWTPKRDATLLRLWPTMSAREVAIELGTTRSAVISRYHRLQGNGEQYKQAKMAKSQLRRDARRQVENEVLHDLKCRLAQGADRNAAILAALEAGATHRAVASVMGLTHQRITQIAARNPADR